MIFGNGRPKIESLAGFLQRSNSLVEQNHFTEGDAEIVVVPGSSSANATSASRSVFSSPNMSAKSTPAFCQKGEDLAVAVAAVGGRTGLQEPGPWD